MYFWCILDTLLVPGCVLTPPTLSSTHQMWFVWTWDSVRKCISASNTSRKGALCIQSTDLQVCSWSSHVCACYFERLLEHYPSAGVGTPWESSGTGCHPNSHIQTFLFYTAEKHAPTIFMTLSPLETRLCKDGGIIKVQQQYKRKKCKSQFPRENQGLKQNINWPAEVVDLGLSYFSVHLNP